MLFILICEYVCFFSEGKTITLKSEDTDVETNKRPQQRRGRKFFTRRRIVRTSTNRSDAGETDAENVCYLKLKLYNQ